MDSRTKKKKGKDRKMKCSYSGEYVGNKEVILTKYAKDYLRQLGYLVSNFRFLFIVLLGLALVIPLATASSPLDVDLGSRINIVMIAIFFVIAGFLWWLRLFVYSAMIILVLGFILLYSGFNAVLSFILISGGVITAFMK